MNSSGGEMIHMKIMGQKTSDVYTLIHTLADGWIINGANVSSSSKQ